MTLSSIVLGDLESLNKLINSTPIDLIKQFKARKSGNVYVIPLVKAPWVVTVNLGYRYQLELEGKRLSIDGINIKYSNKQSRFIVGFLASNGYIYGSYFGSRAKFKCMRINVGVPADLLVPLTNIEFETTQAYVANYVDKVIVPKCSLSNTADLTTSELIMVALNAQAMGNVVAEISNLKVLYS